MFSFFRNPTVGGEMLFIDHTSPGKITVVSVTEVDARQRTLAVKAAGGRRVFEIVRDENGVRARCTTTGRMCVVVAFRSLASS
jgi:hypothetical protein